MKKFCYNCGAELGPEDTICPKCGKPVLVEAPTEEEKAAEKKKFPLKKIILFSAIGIAAAIVLTFAILMIINFAKTGSWSFNFLK